VNNAQNNTLNTKLAGLTGSRKQLLHESKKGQTHVNKKTEHILVNYFAKYLSIFKILSPSDSAVIV